MSVIAVDMTPVLSGGENGGAKILALELLKTYKTMAQEHHFLLLTASWNDEELSILDGPNMRRICVISDEETQVKPLTTRYAGRLQKGLSKIYRYLCKIKQTPFSQDRLLKSRGVDLLFCPFTAPTYAEPSIPVVSIIYDLQHRECPQFFEQQEIDHRNAFYHDVCKKADSIICISQHVRQTVLKLLNVTPESTFTVPICIQKRLAKLDSERIKQTLEDLGIGGRPYMFYPANFWPHKNHRMLLTAYGMFLSRNSENKINLVFTGALDKKQEELKWAAKRMGIASRVHFLGFIGENQLSAIWQGCEFLIFPSLYEGFGIPVIEAMYFGKPVLCSNSTSLPEVAGDVALYFDPRKPIEIVQCLELIIKDTSLKNELVRLGYQREAGFRKEDMANKYMDIFRFTMNKTSRIETV